MKAKNVLYAAVGAPVVAARNVGSRANDLGARISEQTSEYTEGLEKAIEGWAVEGEKVVGRISDGKVIDEITAKVDLDQAKEQVSKLRDQLEDMLATWRTSFRPEKAETQVKTEAPANKAPATKAPAKKPAAKTTKSTTAKTSSPTTTSATKAPPTKAPATKAEKAS